MAFGLAKEVAYANFDESFKVAFRLGVDPRGCSLIKFIRGVIVMPAGDWQESRPSSSSLLAENIKKLPKRRELTKLAETILSKKSKVDGWTSREPSPLLDIIRRNR